ncbi:laminin subunit alpha-3-like [Cheilinus undulatus]|uniref:laminin subunit alpha-3-like n=1 Tax=Cheilinus undulatus TaxID=241271 RepID=UPI001BD69FB2|nr:laminin subunit alpha-3-like [Cheilinus undulatus]
MFLCFSAAWSFLLCCGLVCSETGENPKCGLVKQTKIHQESYSRKFCDPSFSNQTAGGHQSCSSGFYREKSGPNRGQCVPCRCNGLSTECDEQTGDCVNCGFNTTGSRCDRCKEGYYGNTVNRTCQACPCPFTWNKSASLFTHFYKL